MAEGNAVRSPTRLSVIPIVFGAFQLSWLRRSRLAQVVAVPSLAFILIGVYWFYAGRRAGISDSVGWALLLLQTMAFTPFAIACHRVLLLGEESLPRYGVMGWTMREFKFLMWLFVLMLVSFFVIAIAAVILGGIFANVFVFPRRDWEGWFGWILITGCQVLGSYMAARLSLILPSIALEHSYRVADIWQLSRGSGWRLTVVLAGFPWLLHYSQGLVFPKDFPFFVAVLGSALYCVFLVVEVAALSLSYKALSAQK